MKKRRKSKKGIVRVSKTGRRYRKSSKSRTGWTLIGKKKRRTTKRRKATTRRRRTTKRKRSTRRRRVTF